MDTAELAREGQKLLARIGWSQAELARRSGRPETTVNKLLAGTRAPDVLLLNWMRRIAQAIEKLPPPPFRDRRFKDDSE